MGKTARMLLAILIVEAIPMAMSFAASRPRRVAALYDPVPAGIAAILLAALVAIVFVGYAMRAFPLIASRFVDPHPLKLLAIPFAIVTGTMEELWFRRLLMDYVLAAGGGVLPQVVLSALAFGFVHAIWGLFAHRWRVAAGAMIATGTLGAALALVYLVGGRVVAPCIGAHVLINLAIEPWLLFAAISAGRTASRAEHRAVA